MKKFRYKKGIKVALSTVVLLTLATSCRKEMNNLNQDLKSLPQSSLQIDGKEASVLLPGMMTNIESQTDWIYQLQQNLGSDDYSGYMSIPSVFLGNVNNVTYAFVDDWVNYIWDTPSSNILNTWLQWKLKGLDKKYPDLYGIALIVKVFGASRAADAFGPIPYSKFGNSSNVTFDTVQEEYTAFFADLDQAITLLSATEDKTPDVDQIIFAPVDKSTFNGDYAKWIKTANTLKLRLAMRISNVDPATAKTEAESAVSNKYGVLEAADGSFLMNVLTVNPLNTITNVWGDLRLGAPVSSILGGYNDPRLSAMALPATDAALAGKIYGIRTGIELTANTYSNFSKLNVPANSPMKIMDAAESYFLRAEGAVRGWNMGAGSAQTFYETGVRTSFSEFGSSGADTYLADATSTPAAYVDPKNSKNNAPPLSTITIKWNDGDATEKKMERIITQKWIAMFPEGCEAWAEFRRTGYPKLYPITVNNSGGKIADGAFIRRFPYTTTFTNSSKTQVDAAVAKEFGGVDSPAKKLWWDVK